MEEVGMNVKAVLIKRRPTGLFRQPLKLLNLAHFTQRSLRGFLVALTVVGMAGHTQAVFAGEPSETMPIEAFEEINRDYILKQPEIIVDSLRAMDQRQREEAKKRSRDAIAVHRDELLHDSAAPTAGNKKGTVSVVEFFDYRC